MDSAIDNAIKVYNQDETEDALLDAHATGHGFRLEDRKVYSLECRVEKKEYCEDYAKEDHPFDCPFNGSERHKTVALITFDQASEPKRTMTKEEAIQAMKEGKKVTHRYFSENEWISYDYDTLKILTEEGYRHNPIEFWSFRQEPEWEQDWELWSEPGDSEKGDGWIDVNERLPEMFKNVLMFGSEGSMVIGCVDASCSFDTYNLNEGEKVTHWQPLPEPPRKREVK